MAEADAFGRCGERVLNHSTMYRIVGGITPYSTVSP